MNLRSSLAEAWLERYKRTTTTLAHAENAPALFKPEYVDQLVKQAAHESAEYLRWLDEAAR